MTAQAIPGNSQQRRRRCRNRAAHVRNAPDETGTQGVLAQFSHELRNCLGIIRNAMHVFGNGAVGNSAQEKSRVLILRQVEQMARLLDDILDVSRMRDGRLLLHCARIDLCVVISNALHAVERAMHEREHHLAVSLPDGPIWLLGDAARLEQVFVNLLINAAKYTPVGGAISLSVARDATQAIVVLRDSGIGIAGDLLPKVFDLYVQANPSSRKDGLGLGLPLVRSLVESHGGSVSAASNGKGQGSEFTVLLPAFARP